MGTQSASKSRYLLEICDNFTFRQTEYYATFDSSVYEKGTYRYCYKGQIKKNGKPSKPDLFPNDKCLVKVFKDKNYDIKDFVKDLYAYYYSKNITSIFNSKYTNFEPKMFYITPYVSSLEKHASYNMLFFFPIKDSDQMEKIKENEWITIEPFIDGPYKKYVNNDCRTYSNTDKAISFFMHWNWAYTKGKSLICDIQGVKRTHFYELTDPAVQSIDKDFGNSDLGPCSLIIFLSAHKHNEYCKDLPWPNDYEMNKINKIEEEIMNTYRILGYLFGCDDYKDFYKEIIDSTFNNHSTNFYNYIIKFIIFLFLLMLYHCLKKICIKICKIIKDTTKEKLN